MQNGSQIRHPASNYGLHMAESHQHAPGDSSGSGENPGEVLRHEIVTGMNEVWCSFSLMRFIYMVLD